LGDFSGQPLGPHHIQQRKIHMSHNSAYFDILTPVHFISRAAAVYDDKIAVIYEDKQYSYTEFYHRVNRLASALKNQGVGKGDKVAFICPNTPPMLEAHFAVPMIGAVLVSINVRLSPGELTYIIDHSDAKALFTIKGNL